MRQPFVNSLERAGRGLLLGFAQEPNIRRECAVALLVLALVLALPLDAWQQVAILVVAVFVLVVELINTAIERILNIVKPQFHEQVRDIKDLSAGAVLLASGLACAVGLRIFGPYVLFLISHV